MLAALAPVVLALSIWTVRACLSYLQSPVGYGGASIDASGKLVVGPKPPDPKTPLVLSVVTVPLGITWIVLLVLWKRAPTEASKLPSTARQRGASRRARE
jgi:hypothetical protein